ncbi:glycylpeptide N-tetradecanoyltransferase [Coemansia javaensis]|uniref:Glycylpeptide N-tetradecanoyltransferase n=1 Tax=Coemansia javaensis TaxID=2761396 RepID=A0A9W8HD28_9FUNG|nr:glycylpeptide N-tetradecanoyltransferase [Coemansia javaensis]
MDKETPAPFDAAKLQELIRRLGVERIGSADSTLDRLQREEAEERTRVHEFWSTQPVPQSADVVKRDGPLHPPLAPEQIPAEPYALPDAGTTEWCVVDVEQEAQITELYQLLTENYVEDRDSMFRFNYSADFLRWALMPPGFVRDWHVGVRESASGRLIAFISGIPVETMVRDKTMPMAEINFLCLHKDLRGQRLAPLLIKEVTRRVHQRGIFQAVYTVGRLLPKPVATCRYYHRSINPRKLMETGFSHKMDPHQLAKVVAAMRLPPKTATPGLRPMRKGDVGQVRKLLNRFLKTRCEILPVFKTDAEVAHWLLPRDGVVWTYVVDDPEHPGRLCDFFSFYSLPSSALKVEPRSTSSTNSGAPRRPPGAAAKSGPAARTIDAAYLFYYGTKTDYAVELSADERQACAGAKQEKALLKDKTSALISERLVALIADALVLARDAGFDVVNCLDMMDNAMFTERLRFGRGDGHLRYYLFNYSARAVEPNKVGLVMLGLPFGGLSRHEILRGAANRLLYSRFYTYYYAGMFALGVVSLVTALAESCPSVFFIAVEGALCVCMVLEIVTRAVAMQWGFLGSWWNYFDIVIVLFCGTTLILLSRGCSAGSNSEELINTLLLVVRNAAQVLRLLATLRKNRRQADAHSLSVDLENNNASSFLEIIDDVDGLMGATPSHEYHHLHHSYYSYGEDATPAARSADFRISVSSLGAAESASDASAPRPASAGRQPSPDSTTAASHLASRTSATSLHSAPDRIAPRRKGNTP